MALPASWTLVPVTGTYTNRDGSPASGWITFESRQSVVVDGVVIVPKTITLQLDGTGSVNGYLPSTNDTSLSTTGWTYLVTEHMDAGGGRPPYRIEVPYTATLIDLASVPHATAAVASPEMVTLLKATDVGTVVAAQAAVATAQATTDTFIADITAGAGAARVVVANSGRSVADFLSDRVNAKARGVKGDGIRVTGAVSIASGSNALTVAGASFQTADVGKAIEVPGAGAAGGWLYATIATRTSATQVTLSTTAGTTLAAVTKTVTYGTDDSAAFQAIHDSLPATGGEVDIPYAVYMLHTAQNLRNPTKPVSLNISAGVIFAGAYGSSTSLSAWPRANSNETIQPVGPFVQIRCGAAQEGVNSVATFAAVHEALQGSHNGNAGGHFAGFRSSALTGSGWGRNALAQADVGFGGTIHGDEIDVNVYTLDPAALIKGLGISGIGTAIASGGRKADVALEIQHGVGWKRGIDILNSDIGVQIRSTCATALSIYAPAGGTGTVLAGKQLANGNESLWLERATDTSPTGNFVRFRNAANSADLFKVDVAGALTNAGAITSSGIVSGAGFTTTGTTDTFNLALRFAAPTVAAGNVGLGNGTATTVGAAGGATALPATPLGYWIANVGGTTVKIPYYNN